MIKQALNFVVNSEIRHWKQSRMDCCVRGTCFSLSKNSSINASNASLTLAQKLGQVWLVSMTGCGLMLFQALQIFSSSNSVNFILFFALFLPWFFMAFCSCSCSYFPCVVQLSPLFLVYVWPWASCCFVRIRGFNTFLWFCWIHIIIIVIPFLCKRCTSYTTAKSWLRWLQIEEVLNTANASFVLECNTNKKKWQHSRQHSCCHFDDIY